MDKDISKRIKELRAENRLTQLQFGAKLNVSQDTVSLWEKGKSLPSTACVILMCKTFNVSADVLLGLKEF